MPTYPPIPLPWTPEARSHVAEALQSIVYGDCPIPSNVSIADRYAAGERLEIWHVPFAALVAVPETSGPWPVLVGLSFSRLHTLDGSESIPITSEAGSSTAQERGSANETWPLRQITQAGWAVAVAFMGDVEPDDPKSSGGLAISRWANGVQTLARSVELDSRFDHRRIVAVGHSRLGKAALLAAGLDEALAGVVGIQSGCGGAAPSRTSVGETIKDITAAFPHWFCPEFASFADDPDKLPLDQHWLLALCASRPCLLCNASDDTWANPRGQHEMLNLAAAVYGEELPPLAPGEAVGGRLSHFYRHGGHEVNAADWLAILFWLDRWFW